MLLVSTNKYTLTCSPQTFLCHSPVITCYVNNRKLILLLLISKLTILQNESQMMLHILINLAPEIYVYDICKLEYFSIHGCSCNL